MRKGIEVRRLWVLCPKCRGNNTYENNKDFGRIILNGLYCADCGQAFQDGSEQSHIKALMKTD